jgi:hypothetical protein
VNHAGQNLLKILMPTAVRQFSNMQMDHLHTLQQRFAKCVNTWELCAGHQGEKHTELGLSDVDDICSFQLSPWYAPPHPADDAYRKYRKALQGWGPVKRWRVLLIIALYSAEAFWVGFPRPSFYVAGIATIKRSFVAFTPLHRFYIAP